MLYYGKGKNVSVDISNCVAGLELFFLMESVYYGRYLLAPSLKPVSF